MGERKKRVCRGLHCCHFMPIKREDILERDNIYLSKIAASVEGWLH